MIENVISIKNSSLPLAVTGEVIFESGGDEVFDKPILKANIQESLSTAIAREKWDKNCVWASFLVLFASTPTKDIRCQIDIETNGTMAGFSIGFGKRPIESFQDAVEKISWHDKDTHPLLHVV